MLIKALVFSLDIENYASATKKYLYSSKNITFIRNIVVASYSNFRCNIINLLINSELPCSLQATRLALFILISSFH